MPVYPILPPPAESASEEQERLLASHLQEEKRALKEKYFAALEDICTGSYLNKMKNGKVVKHNPEADGYVNKELMLDYFLQHAIPNSDKTTLKSFSTELPNTIGEFLADDFLQIIEMIETKVQSKADKEKMIDLVLCQPRVLDQLETIQNQDKKRKFTSYGITAASFLVLALGVALTASGVLSPLGIMLFTAFAFVSMNSVAAVLYKNQSHSAGMQKALARIQTQDFRDQHKFFNQQKKPWLIPEAESIFSSFFISTMKKVSDSTREKPKPSDITPTSIQDPDWESSRSTPRPQSIFTTQPAQDQHSPPPTVKPK